MKNIELKYKNSEITVVWKPYLCNHSAVCLKGLPSVFDTFSRPWIKMDAASTEKIKEVVDECPTRAISWYANSEGKMQKDESSNEISDKTTTVTLIKDGPVLISGSFILINENNEPVPTEDKISICRCGKSTRLPFCDGSHKKLI
jgi:uncharacterized Fe-S cluster protein YjdI